jgi:hypothetical protein
MCFAALRGASGGLMNGSWGCLTCHETQSPVPAKERVGKMWRPPGAFDAQLGQHLDQRVGVVVAGLKVEAELGATTAAAP